MLPRHGRYDLSMIDERPIYDWPNGKRLAFYVGNNIETFAFGAGLGSDPAFRTEARQTQRNHAWRDYGHRVGIWRLLDVLDEFQIPAAHEAESSIHNKYKTKRLSPDEMSKFHTKSGFEECYPIDLMGKLSEEIKML